MTVFFSQLINGLSLGSIYALIALGYSMVYGIILLLNFAHGDVIMVGAYMSWFVMNQLGLGPVTAVCATIITCTLLGVVIEKIAYTPLGITLALTFVTLPFVVRTVQPILEDLDTEYEEAAVSLGANRWQAFRHVILPIVFPALLTGFAMAFARAVGEYGSVIFIAGNIPMVSEITPLMIITKLEQYDYAGATAIAVVMLVFSFTLLLAINGLQAWAAKRTGRER